VRKFLEGAIANNVDHLGAVLTADFVFRFGARSVLAGSHRGIEGLSRLFTKYDENMAETPHGECFDTAFVGHDNCCGEDPPLLSGVLGLVSCLTSTAMVQSIPIVRAKA